jgi:hypothetical protein
MFQCICLPLPLLFSQLALCPVKTTLLVGWCADSGISCWCLSFAWCREMTWWSTLGSNLRVSASLLMGGCNLMAPAVWSPQSSLVMWAALRPWLSSGHSMHKVLPSVPWRACSLAQLQSSTGPLLGMTSPGTGNHLCIFTVNHASYLLLGHFSGIHFCSSFPMEMSWCNAYSVGLNTKNYRMCIISPCTWYWIFFCLKQQLSLLEKLQVRDMLPDCFGYQGWGGGSWGWRNNSKTAMWPVHSRLWSHLINWCPNMCCGLVAFLWLRDILLLCFLFLGPLSSVCLSFFGILCGWLKKC